MSLWRGTVCANCQKEQECVEAERMFKSGAIVYGCSECVPKPQTNADRIRQMPDEELDKFLGEVQWDVANYCGGVTKKQEYPVPEQRGAWLDWLKAPVDKEVDNG